MQNENSVALAGALPAGARNTLREALGEPRAVLFLIGGSGFIIDLWKPISVVGFALLVLATAPWIVEAFQQRSRRMVKAVEVPRESGRADPKAIEEMVAAERPGKISALRRSPGESELPAAMPHAQVIRTPPKSPAVQESRQPAPAAPARQASAPTALHDVDRPRPRRVPQTPTNSSGAT